MHVFPQLRKLEEKYPGELAVVGVHSAKFTAEKSSVNLRKAILRYEIEHPVVNDKDFQIWQQYAVRAWPTLMFIDPTGKLIGKHEGEITFDQFDQIIGDMVEEYDSQSILNHQPLHYKLEKEKEWERPLSFPGKILADPIEGRIFIADSNHNRLLVVSSAGRVQHVIGSGTKGLADGEYGQAQFNDPQGMALEGEILYVADTKNHAIRAVDLNDKKVTTIAGTGDKAAMFNDGGDAIDTALNSPWDVVYHQDSVYIAMAGFHQLWKLDLASRTVRPYAGSGRERIVDGALSSAQLAQPSGIATDGTRLHFTDSETSAVRSADLDEMGDVTTIVGKDLFTFGDVDGMGDDVRLQHPLGIDLHEGLLFITDTYNNKIKKIDPNTRTATSIIGSGEPGHEDGSAMVAKFHEPGGISIANGKIYIADTNNHAVRVADLTTLEVSTLKLTGL